MVLIIHLLDHFPFLSILGNTENKLLGRQFPMNPNIGYPPDLVDRENKGHWFLKHVVKSFLGEEVQTLFREGKGAVRFTGLDWNQFETRFV
jgi:hypothetical protein